MQSLRKVMRRKTLARQLEESDEEEDLGQTVEQEEKDEDEELPDLD